MTNLSNCLVLMFSDERNPLCMYNKCALRLKGKDMFTNIRTKTLALTAAMVMVVALFTATLASCGNDNAFVGTWSSDVELNGVPMSYAVTFEDGGAGRIQIDFKGELGDLIKEAGGEASTSTPFTWEAKKDQVTLTLTETEGDEPTQSFGKLDADNNTLTFLENTGDGEEPMEIVLTRQSAEK